MSFEFGNTFKPSVTAINKLHTAIKNLYEDIDNLNIANHLTVSPELHEDFINTLLKGHSPSESELHFIDYNQDCGVLVEVFKTSAVFDEQLTSEGYKLMKELKVIASVPEGLEMVVKIELSVFKKLKLAFKGK